MTIDWSRSKGRSAGLACGRRSSLKRWICSPLKNSHQFYCPDCGEQFIQSLWGQCRLTYKDGEPVALQLWCGVIRQGCGIQPLIGVFAQPFHFGWQQGFELDVSCNRQQIKWDEVRYDKVVFGKIVDKVRLQSLQEFSGRSGETSEKGIGAL